MTSSKYFIECGDQKAIGQDQDSQWEAQEIQPQFFKKSETIPPIWGLLFLWTIIYGPKVMYKNDSLLFQSYRKPSC